MIVKRQVRSCQVMSGHFQIISLSFQLIHFRNKQLFVMYKRGRAFYIHTPSNVNYRRNGESRYNILQKTRVHHEREEERHIQQDNRLDSLPTLLALLRASIMAIRGNRSYTRQKALQTAQEPIDFQIAEGRIE